jgi:hypothetical protein
MWLKPNDTKNYFWHWDIENCFRVFSNKSVFTIYIIYGFYFLPLYVVYGESTVFVHIFKFGGYIPFGPPWIEKSGFYRGRSGVCLCVCGCMQD